MNAHWLVLVVVLPLWVAPCCLLVRHRGVSRFLAVMVAWVCLALSIALHSQVQEQGVIQYALGGWVAPYGIEYRLDALNSFVLCIVSGVASVVLPFGAGAHSPAVPEGRESMYYAVFLLCICGLLGIAVTGDLFNVFVFLEISSLSAYTLIALGKGRRALRAAFTYLAMGTLGGTFFLLGVGLLYQVTGTLNMVDLTSRFGGALDSRTVMVATAFLTVGTGIKLAVFPLHQWLPNAYTYAPSKVSAFLAATATKVSFYVLARTVFCILGAGYVFGTLHLDRLLLVLALAAMFIGSLAAIYQTNIKRLLAYSSIAQIGYMTLGLSMGNDAGLTGSVLHLFNHALMKGGLFLVVACVSFRLGSVAIEDWRGLGKKMPWSSAAFVVGGMSLIGVPGTVGFVSKWYLVLGALAKGWFAVAALILLSSFLALVYVWRVVEVLFLREPAIENPVQEAPWSMRLPTWVLIGGTVVFGLYTDWTVSAAQAAVTVLLGGGA